MVVPPIFHLRRSVTSGREWKAFGDTIWRTKWSLVGILVLVFVIHALHLVQGLELPSLDAWQRSLAPRDAAFVRIVAIDDADFAGLFDGQIPLKPDVIARLLDVIAAAHPAVIGVDINTSTPGFAALADRSTWGSIVWARNAVQRGDVVEADAVLGGRTPPAPGRASIALAAVDTDAAVRRMPRMLETAAGPRASFHWAIVEAACEAGVQAPGCRNHRPSAAAAEHDLLVNLYRRRVQLRPMSTSTLLQIGAQLPAGTGPEAFTNRVVLLGGTFRAGRDVHQTPIGEMAGVEAWAHAIETELNAEGVEEVRSVWLTLCDIVIALLMIWLHHFVGGRRAFVAMIVVVPLVMIAASLVLFRVAGLVLTFVPIVLAIVIHQLVDDYLHA